MIDTISLQVLKVITLNVTSYDTIKVIEDKILVLAGMDTFLKLYSLDSEKFLYKVAIVNIT